MGRAGVTVLVVLLALSLVGNFFLYTMYSEATSEVSKVKSQYEREIITLKGQIKDLEYNVTRLKSGIDTYERMVETLRKSNEELADELYKLRQKYQSLKNEVYPLRNLKKNYELYYNYSRRYFELGEFLKHVITDTERKKLRPHIAAAVSDPSDFAKSIAEITEYVADHVKYAADPEVPAPPHPIIMEESYYIPAPAANIFMTPSETLERGYGDCDDINTLLYAMIRFYMQDFYGEDYALYLVVGYKEEGGGHLFVILPVQGGKMTVLDATGSAYWTGKSLWGEVLGIPTIEAKPVREAWNEYMERIEEPFDKIEVYSIDEYGPIKRFEGSQREFLEWMENVTER
ncbi:hypothetical protein [Pyrococcus kukulkanii]|uniref:hypothetical protein n=1 Tax=Pyrococcus kukulkanii TaxID=1609559 RepID=UPI00128F560E|nr:hypothetical protein [Pyrococcus kukulkanii]